MIIPLVLLMAGIVGLVAKYITIKLTLERIAVARDLGASLYVQRSGATLLNLQFLALGVLLLLTGVNATAFLMDSQPVALTPVRIVRGALYLLAYMLLISHAIYSAVRYNGDTKMAVGDINDAMRNAMRDTARDEERDPARDEGRDTGRDVPRDLARDRAHDEAPKP